MPMQIAYLVNQYPKVSHSFIRREILALERLGARVQRIALRGWDAELVDAGDRRERELTEFVLQRGWRGLLGAVLAMAAAAPRQLASALARATRIGLGRSDRALPYHWIYLAEACVVARWLRRSGATHLHAHFGTNSAEVAMYVHLLQGTPYSFTVHGPEEFDRPEFIGLREKCRHADFVVAVSSFGRSQLYRWIDAADWAKVQVVHCGLDAEFIDAAPTPPAEAMRLVCVGRLCEQKGQLLLVQAMRRVIDRGRDFELVLAGDGELRPEVEALVATLGLGARVCITGWIDGAQVRRELQAARALVLPSFAEGLPVVIMEAMALGRPVLSTYVAGIPELVLDGACGWLVPAGDVERLADAIEACLAAPPERLAVLGAAARSRVVERHAIDDQAAHLLRLMQPAAGR
jgi:colanic acid/amylovoran biosynthesis glycosyltransferase